MSQPEMTLEEVVADPDCATFYLHTPGGAVLAPLRPSDEAALASFFDGLSSRTRQFYSVTDPLTEARDRCAAIARYDKLRLLLREGGLVVALVEFSFDLVITDIDRFVRYGVTLHPDRDCRWGLCVSDERQGRGVGKALAVPSFDLARRFGRDRVILWGGVQVANAAAVRYYGKVGFTEIGQFTNDAGVASLDMLRTLGEP
jgi:GNAT superfamily N-acetyltransferase